jgi:hypothetical protein
MRKQLKQNQKYPKILLINLLYSFHFQVLSSVRHGVLLSQTELELQKCIRYLEPIHQYPRLCLDLQTLRQANSNLFLWCLSFIKFSIQRAFA